MNKTEQFIAKAVAVHGDRFSYVKTEYLKQNSPVIIICKEHGEFQQIPKTHLRGHGCQKCGLQKASDANDRKRLNNAQFIRKSNELYNNKYDYSLVKYVNWRSKVEIICPHHGLFWQVPNDHLQGKECPKCKHPGIKKTFSDFVNDAISVHGDKYDYSLAEYYRNKSKIDIVCPKHGVFQQTPSGHLSGKGCLLCVYDNNTINQVDIINGFIETHGDKYDYSLVEYKHNKNKVSIICPDHGVFWQRPDCHRNGHNCPKCSTVISKPHKSVESMLPDGVSVSHNDRNAINPHEIDVWIPDHNVGVEIHGVYWHGLKRNNIQHHNRLKSLHHIKATAAANAGISLLQFWDLEINQKPDLVKSMVQHHLGLSDRIYARKCKIRKSSNAEIAQFVDQCHLQGHRNASVTYVLEYDGELVSVVSFSRHPKHQWEIIRYACKHSTTVVGGFSRLLKTFISDYNPNEILTFADRRISRGNMYLQNGFKQVAVTKPNYFYFKGGEILSRQKCQKHKLPQLLGNTFDNNLSEVQNMLLNGYAQIFDAGHIKLIWKRD